MSVSTDPPVTILEPGRSDRQYWRDLWTYRELFAFLAWRDIAVRYKQTAIGVAWAVIRPFMTMVVLTVVFKNVAGLSSGDVPYALTVLAATLPWQLFATALGESGNSLVTNSALISKVYFPRLIVPTSAVVVSLADFFISLGILAGMMLWYQFLPPWQIITLPAFLAVAFIAALGPGLLVTALNVRYRDFRFIVPFVIQFGIFVTPVGYSGDKIYDKFGELIYLAYSVNPMVGVIDGFRWAICDIPLPYAPAFLVSITSALLFLWIGITYFRRTERTFADII